MPTVGTKRQVMTPTPAATEPMLFDEHNDVNISLRDEVCTTTSVHMKLNNSNDAPTLAAKQDTADQPITQSQVDTAVYTKSGDDRSNPRTRNVYSREPQPESPLRQPKADVHAHSGEGTGKVCESCQLGRDFHTNRRESSAVGLVRPRRGK